MDGESLMVCETRFPVFSAIQKILVFTEPTLTFAVQKNQGKNNAYNTTISKKRKNNH